MDEKEKTQEQVDQAAELLENGRRKLGDLAKTASEKSKQAFTFTDEWVRENPWLALGVVAGVGLIIGLLVGRGSSDES